jgi:hypothetical protein
MLAAAGGSEEICRLLLRKDGVDVNAVDEVSVCRQERVSHFAVDARRVSAEPP